MLSADDADRCQNALKHLQPREGLRVAYPEHLSANATKATIVASTEAVAACLGRIDAMSGDVTSCREIRTALVAWTRVVEEIPQPDNFRARSTLEHLVAVELFHWSPVRPVIDLPLVRRFSPRRALKNFGDEIGPMIVRAIIDERGLVAPESSDSTGRLLSVGSVLHFAAAGDHVWGTGINGKIEVPLAISPGDISIHAVRGPRTKQRLESLGFEVPPVFGDPGLLLPHVDSRYAALRDRTKRRKLAVIPNLNDLGDYRRHPDFVSPLQDPLTIAEIIAESEFITGSSLHAMVFADTLGTPSRLIASKAEHPFKYEDYYLGTGRQGVTPANSVDSALRAGGTDEMMFEAGLLLAAFPVALF